MAIALSCPSCDRELKVKDELAGHKIKCPKCGGTIAVLDKKDDEEPEEDERPRKKKKKKKAKSNRNLIIGSAIGVLVLVVVIVLIIVFSGGSGATDKVAKKKPEPPPPEIQQPVVAEPPPIQKKATVGALARSREVTDVRNDLRQIALAYHNYVDSVDKRGPKSKKELSPFYENNRRINEALDNKWYTVIWSVSAQNIHSNEILAYETDADGQGNRIVVMGDQSVQTIGEQEFQSAPKAKGK